MPDRYDIFLSYPSADRAPATALKAALETLGLSVWMDAERIDDANSIQRCIDTGLARSRVLVAWYSENYAQSRACQWELTAALIVSQFETLATRRVLVVNPEPGTAHIVQTMVKDIELIPATEPMSDLAGRLKTAGAEAQGLLGDIRRLARPPWHGQKKGLGSRRFVGRLSELWQVQNALTGGRFAIVAGQPSPGAAVGLTFVRGSGGMGKSLLAEEYALRFGAFWPGGIFWLDALGVSDRPVEAPAALAQRRESYHLEQLGIFAIALDIDSQGLNLRQLRALMGRKLQQGGEHYLWVVDDLPECERDALDDWLAPSAKGGTLITSRARQYDALSTPVELGILQSDDAYALLCLERKPHNAQEEAAARSILQRLGRHAMAVDQARAACAAQGFTGFLARLDMDDKRALALSKDLAGDLPNGHERDIAKTFLTSIESLSTEAQGLLTLAVQLSHAPISSDLIAACKLAHQGAASQGAGAADEQAEHKALMGAQDWAARCMKQLTDCSLADPSAVEPAAPDAPAVPAITVHTLIARVARWRLADGTANTQATQASQATVQWRQAAVSTLQHALRAAADIRQHAALLHEVQHARQLCEQVETLDQAILLARIAEYDDARGHYALARAAWQTVLKLWERVLGPEQPDTLASMSNLANTLRAMGELADARAMQEQVLAIQQRVLGPEHHHTLSSMNNLAVTLHAMGELPSARAMHEQVLDIRQRVLGAEHPETLTSMNNLAGTLRAAGELPAARAMYEQALDISQRVLRPEHLETLSIMNNLANALCAMCELPAARAMQEQVLEICQRVRGSEHPHTLGIMNNLASTLRAMGELPAARAMQEQVLDICQRVLGSEHPHTLGIMNNLAGTLRAMGELPAARAMQVQVLDIRKRVLGPEHPDILGSMNDLAGTLRIMGELPAARAMHEQVLDIGQRVLGPEHPDTLSSMDNLAETLRAMGELPAARARHKQVLAIRKHMLGAEHYDTLSSINNLAATLHAMGELPAARAMQEQVLNIQRRVLGPEQPNTLTSMNNLADTLRAMGELPAARAMQVQVLDIRQRVLGSEHPDTLSSINNLAATFHAIGELLAARAIQEQALDIQQRVLGSEHPDTLTSMNNLAATLHAMGELPAARAMQVQVLDMRQRVLGPEHPDTVSASGNLLNMLAQAKANAGRKATATRYPATMTKLMAEWNRAKDK